VLGCYRDALRKIQQEPGCARHQIIERDKLQRAEGTIHGDGQAHGAAAGAENVYAQSIFRVDQLQQNLAGRIERVNVPA
jgi:hypothetical protein